MLACPEIQYRLVSEWGKRVSASPASGSGAADAEGVSTLVCCAGALCAVAVTAGVEDSAGCAFWPAARPGAAKDPTSTERIADPVWKVNRRIGAENTSSSSVLPQNGQ